MRAEGQTVPDKTVSKDAWGWDADWKNKEERNYEHYILTDVQWFSCVFNPMLLTTSLP